MPQNSELVIDERSPLLLEGQDENVVLDKFSGASFHGSVFNLSCTVIGSGIMSLPATLNILGIVPGIILIVLAAFLNEASIEMLLRFSKPGSAFSYGDVMGDAFGTIGKILVQASVIINNIGVLVVFMIIIGMTSMLPALLFKMKTVEIFN